MGNCFPLHTHTASSEKVLKVIKTDGKILAYTKPMLVKDILENFSDDYSIGLSRKPHHYLPQDYKLKVGNVCYLIPTVSSISINAFGDSPATASSVTMGSSKTIKLIITKQELQKLLSKKISAEEIFMLGVIKKEYYDDVDDDDARCGATKSSFLRWQPVLETIAEGSE